MLFVSWQLKTTVYVIFLTACLGQELFRTCERDYCFERSIEKQRFEREQSRRLSNEESRILENHDGRLSIRIPSDDRMKREIVSDITNRFVYRGEDTEKNSNQPLRSLHTAQESDRRLNNNREQNDRVLERVDKITRERNFDTDFKNDHEQRRFGDSEESFSFQEFKRHLDNRDNKKPFNNNREKNYKDSVRFDERANIRISGRDLANTPEERRSNSKVDDGSYLVRRLNLVREQVNRQNILQQFDAHEESKPLDTRRDERQRNENLERRYNNREEQNERVSVSRRRIDSIGNIQRHDSLNRRSENVNELNDRKTDAERDIKRNSDHFNQRTADKIINLSNFRKMDKNVVNELEINKERQDAHEDNRRSENRRKTERIETFMHRKPFGDHSARRDISHRQNLLSVRGSETQAEIRSRRSENTSQNRRVALQIDAAARSVNRQEASRRFEVNEPRQLENCRGERNQERYERQEASESARDNRNGYQETHKRLHNSEFQRTLQRENNKVQHENSEGRTVTENREELVRNSRLYVIQGSRNHRSLHLGDERDTHLRQLNNRENEDKRERAEPRLVQRADREVQNNVNGYLTSFHQDNTRRSETRRSYEREIKKSSEDNQRLRVDISERNKRESQQFESSRQYDERNGSYDEKSERKSMRRNERIEYRNVETRMNDQRDSRFPDNAFEERNNAHITKPKTTNFYYTNNRFIQEDNIEKPTVLISKVYTTLGQSLLFVYLVMKTCNVKTDLINQLQTKLRGALLIIGF